MDPGWILRAFNEHLRPRGRHTGAECLLALAFDDLTGQPRRSVSRYMRDWRVSREVVKRVLAISDDAPSKGADCSLQGSAASKPRQIGLEGVEQRRSQMVNLLPAKDGAGEFVGTWERQAWWEVEGPTVEADAAADAVVHGVEDPSGQATLLRSTAIRYFKRYLAGERRFQGAKEAERLQDGAERYFAKAEPMDDPLPGDRPSRRLRHMEG